MRPRPRRRSPCWSRCSPCALIALILPPFIARLADLGTNVQEGVQRVAYSLGESVAG